MKHFLLISTVVFFTATHFSQAVIAQTVELRFSWWGGDLRHKPLLEVIKLFESKNPSINIKPEYMGFSGYAERLTTQFSGGNEPDIMQINWAWISTMYSKKGDGFYDLYRLKQYIKLDEWPKAMLAQCVHNGKLNALPASFTARLFLWQKTTFDKAGLPLPKTWDDLFKAGKVFQEKLGKDYYPMDGINYDVILMTHAYMFQKTGKQWIDPNKPQVAFTKSEALEWIAVYKKMTETKAVIPNATRMSISGPEAPTELQQPWIKGEWAGNLAWDTTFKTRLSTLPSTTVCDVGDFLTLKGAKKSGLFGRTTQLFAVKKNCKDPVAAVRFINFMLTSPESVKILGTALGTLITKTGYETTVRENKIDSLSRKGFDQIRKMKIDDPSPYFEHAKIQELVRAIFEEISFGKTTDEKAAERLTTETNKVLLTIQ
jgi:oligogalacturonide transport system substrate-binding protein